jgi:DNA-binding MarR family transcriptional regulator
VPDAVISASSVRAARELRVFVSRLRRRLRDELDNGELTPSQLSLVSRLAKDGPATASALAAAERVRPQSVAATLAVLEDRGLVRRRQDPADGRRQLVSLTQTGEELSTDRRRSTEEWLTRALQESYSEAERRTIIEATALLERLSTA